MSEGGAGREAMAMAAFLAHSRTMVELLLEGQPDEALAAVLAAAAQAGSCMVLEVTYKSAGPPDVALHISGCAGERTPITRVEYMPAGGRH